jgi:hypothetical protein
MRLWGGAIAEGSSQGILELYMALNSAVLVGKPCRHATQIQSTDHSIIPFPYKYGTLTRRDMKI